MPSLDKVSQEKTLPTGVSAQYDATVVGDTVLSPAFDMTTPNAKAARFSLIVYTLASNVANTLTLRNILIETDNNPAFLDPRILTSDNFIGDLSDLEGDYIGGDPLAFRKLGVLGCDRFIRIQVTADYDEAVNSPPSQYTVLVDVDPSVTPDEIN